MNTEKYENQNRLPYTMRADFHVGKASDLSGWNRAYYRFLEIMPGLVSWATLLLVVFLSIFVPVVAAYFIIAFALYWLLKTIFLSLHLRHNWARLRHNLKVDWKAMLAPLKYEHLYHVVVLPFYEEPEEVVAASIKSLAECEYRNDRIIVVLGTEARAGESAQAIARKMKETWGTTFAHVISTTHPADIVGEMPGKGSNASYALEETRRELLDVHAIPYENVIVSIFDIDTVVYPQYFNCLTWHFLTAEDPYKTSFQPIPVFNNNIWEAPAFSRVVAMSSTFWEMIQQERPERMATFSSHSLSFKALYEVGYWQPNMVNEDSRIYWNLFIANNGNYRVVPLAYPVSMDANAADSLWKTIKNIYRQHRRWTYGVENFVYIAYHFTKNKQIALGERLRILAIQGEGYWSLVTNPIMLMILGWLPIFFGGRAFHETVLSYNLPIVVRDILSLAMFGLIVSAMISLTLVPKRPESKGRYRYIALALQWVLVPITMIIFSSLPGLDAQTRLMFGRYLGFWVTPKSRAAANEPQAASVV